MKQYMPEEITANILSRLPIKSLFRFKCVSKPWLTLISDTHLNLCPRQQVAVVDHVDPTVEVNLLGCCNGLLLLSIGLDFFLCNPTTNHCKHIFTFDNGDCGRCGLYGLCYNSTEDNYIAILTLERANCALKFRVKEKTWEWDAVDFYDTDMYRNYSQQPGLICNGRLHWLVTGWTGRRVILCFDPLREEKHGGFTEFDPPMVGDQSSIEGCGVFWESILSVCIHDREKGHVKVMAMLDQNSWSTMFVIPSDVLFEHFVDTVTPLCLSKEGKLIMLVGRSELVAYCPRKRSCWYTSPVMGAMTFVETRVASSQFLSNAEDMDRFIETQMHNHISLLSDFHCEV